MKNININFKKKIPLNKKEILNLLTFLGKKLLFDVKELTINFVGNDTIHQINFNYLKHDYPTDIITFYYNRSKKNLDGEIFISTDEALNSALKFKVTLDNELKRLIIHGILHLCGYDDQTKSEKIKMKRKENILLKKYIEYKEIN